MASVKTPSGTASVATRIRLIRRALNKHGTKELGWPEFAAFAGVPLGTAKHWEERSQIGADSADALAERLRRAGYPCSGAWIRKGTRPEPPWTAAVASEDSTLAALKPHPGSAEREDGRAFPPRTSDAGRSPGVLQLAAEAQRIAAALGKDLAYSEAPIILDGTTELGRQQALIWSLKQLARDLHVLGFDMRNMFHVTDELAAKIGLPVQQRHECGGSVPIGSKFCPSCGEAV